MVDELLIDNYDKLILHCDGTDGSTAFRDSATGKVVTAVGTAQVDTAQSKFGGASLLLDGNSDKLTVADSADFDFGTGDFTVDCWVRFAADPSAIQPVIVAIGPDAGGLVISVVSKEPYLYFGSTAYGFSGTTYFAVDTWCHLAVVRSGNNLLTFMDGVQVDSDDVTGKSHATSTGMTIGKDNAGTGFDWFNGWIDEVRVSKGIARWTENFTPPDAAYYGKEVYIASSTWTVPSNVSSVKALVVAGGGGGGNSNISNYNAGGGGAGGKIYNASFAVTPAAELTVTVGAGGAAQVNGSDSVFGSLTAVGGGKGGSNGAASSGGSGGGGAGNTGYTSGGAGTATQGYAGGDGVNASYAGGGGGAGEVGNTDGDSYGGDGYDASADFGTSVGVAGWFAGGGGGGHTDAEKPGGTGGGGTGGATSAGPTIGIANTGGGGGGGGNRTFASQIGGAGGSGIVILSYVYSTGSGFFMFL